MTGGGGGGEQEALELELELELKPELELEQQQHPPQLLGSDRIWPPRCVTLFVLPSVECSK